MTATALEVHKPASPVVQGETASTAVAAQAKAAVEARYLVAMQRPRNWMDVRSKLLDACSRPAFAAEVEYSKPVSRDKTVDGPSIRFAEEAVRAMTNILVESIVVFDDAEKRIVRVTATDLESNVSYPLDIAIEKTVERSYLKQGQTAIRSRLNSQNRTTYLVEATEDDLLTKQNNLTSKAIRNTALRLLPSDIKEEAIERARKTVADEDAKDPGAALKRVVALFHARGVSARDLSTYLGHPVESLNNAELANLRTVHQALKEGETTWAQVIEQRTTATDNGATATRNVGKKGTGADSLKAAIGATPAKDTHDESKPADGQGAA